MTTVEHSAFASPLSLLRQWRDDLTDGPPLRELVILGFTLDLAFFERFCVPPARQLGARVTVVADADQAMHDAVDVHFAGRSYQHGAAFLPGAFHPKVAILLGDKHVWFAIGSGNPTMAGWGHNHELWFVLKGRVSAGPRVQAELGAWLQRLPDHVIMPSWIATTLVDVGRRMTPANVDDTHLDIHLLHNLDTSIVNNIPHLAAAELRLAAPFVDPSGQAVRDLVDRAAPSRLRIALQRDLSSYNGPALLEITAAVEDVEFRDVDDQRTMHGKLIEWTDPSGGGATAVVGSPNLTSAALLGSVSEGRNCELAVAAPVRESLLPDTLTLSPVEVAARGWNRPDIQDSRPGLHLLGCRVGQDGLDVELLSRHAVDVTIETSPDGSPGSWAAKAIIAAAAVNPRGTTSGHVDAPEVVGGAVRAVAVIRDMRVESAAVFVTDLRRCRPRTDVADAPRLRQEYGVDELITDPALGERFSQDLMRLLDQSAKARTGSSATGAPAVSVQSEIDRWQRFLDVVAHSVGGALAELTFPGALPSPSLVTPTTGWSVADIADETELADDETESAIDNIDSASAHIALRVPPALRSRYRGWMRRWVSRITPTPTAATPALPLRMTVAALYLELLAAGVWAIDEGWRTELANVVGALTADPAERADAPEQSHSYLGSLLAVCLTLLLQDASLHGGAPADVVARRAWKDAFELAAKADPAIIEAMLLTSTQADARLVTFSEVAEVVILARNALDDPQAESLAGLASDGFNVERHDGVWIVRGKVRNTPRVAARVITELNTAEGVAAVVISTGRTTIMLRHGRTLVMADSMLRHWRTYLIGWPSTPTSLFSGGAGLPSARQAAPLRPIPTDVNALAQQLGCPIEPLIAIFLPGPRE